jgi:hypothetical protein
VYACVNIGRRRGAGVCRGRSVARLKSLAAAVATTTPLTAKRCNGAACIKGTRTTTSVLNILLLLLSAPPNCLPSASLRAGVRQQSAAEKSNWLEVCENTVRVYCPCLGSFHIRSTFSEKGREWKGGGRGGRRKRPKQNKNQRKKKKDAIVMSLRLR